MFKKASYLWGEVDVRCCRRYDAPNFERLHPSMNLDYFKKRIFAEFGFLINAFFPVFGKFCKKNSPCFLA